MIKVFVYGTLKKGHAANNLMGKSEYLGKAVIQGYKLYNIGGFPTIKPTDDKDCFVSGDVYEVDEDVMSDLDTYEGISSNLFKHINVTCYLDTQEGDEVHTLKCVAYELCSHPGKYSSVITDGEWKGR